MNFLEHDGNVFWRMLKISVKFDNDIGVEFLHGIFKTTDIGSPNARFLGGKRKEEIIVFLLKLLDYFVGTVW